MSSSWSKGERRSSGSWEGLRGFEGRVCGRVFLFFVAS